MAVVHASDFHQAAKWLIRTGFAAEPGFRHAPASHVRRTRQAKGLFTIAANGAGVAAGARGTTLPGAALARRIYSFLKGSDASLQAPAGSIRSGQAKSSVELSASATRTEELLKALRAGCERLVHPSVTEATARGRHARLIGILLASPLLVVGGDGDAFSPGVRHRRDACADRRRVHPCLVCRCRACRWAAGKPASSRPPWRWRPGPGRHRGCIRRPGVSGASRRPGAAVRGRLAGSHPACGAGRNLGRRLPSCRSRQCSAPSLPAAAPQPTGWHWILPLAYAAFAVPRAAAWVAEVHGEPPGPLSPGLEDVIDAVDLRFAPTGEVVDASPQARRIVGVAPELLLGDGLFDRIHVADRVGYLCALAELRHGAGRAARRAAGCASPVDRNGPGAYRPFLLEMMRGEDCGEAILAVLRSNEEVAGLRASLAASREAAEKRGDRQEPHPCRGQPRAAHAAERDHRLLGHAAAARCSARFRDPAPEGICRPRRASSGRHLLAVVNSILDVSRLESGAYATNPEPFRFGDAVDMCRSMLARQAGAKRVDISTRDRARPRRGPRRPARRAADADQPSSPTRSSSRRRAAG